ncbi:MAG: hypothetical protein ABIX01_08205 [Chitinophagaceae bacterium]
MRIVASRGEKGFIEKDEKAISASIDWPVMYLAGMNVKNIEVDCMGAAPAGENEHLEKRLPMWILKMMELFKMIPGACTLDFNAAI